MLRCVAFAPRAVAPPDAATNGPGGKRGNKLLSLAQLEFALGLIATELGEEAGLVKAQAAGFRPQLQA